MSSQIQTKPVLAKIRLGSLKHKCKGLGICSIGPVPEVWQEEELEDGYCVAEIRPLEDGWCFAFWRDSMTEHTYYKYFSGGEYVIESDTLISLSNMGMIKIRKGKYLLSREEKNLSNG